MTPEKLDALIFEALADGACALNGLARRIDQDAREILRRLHVLGGHGQVGSRSEAGSIVWFSRRPDAASTEQPSEQSRPALESINRAAVVHRKARSAQTTEGETRMIEVAVATPEPPAQEVRPRKKRQPIIVRPRLRVLELRVTPINQGDAIIQAESDDEGGAIDEVFVPAADLPALIRALTAVMAD